MWLAISPGDQAPESRQAKSCDRGDHDDALPCGARACRSIRHGLKRTIQRATDPAAIRPWSTNPFCPMTPNPPRYFARDAASEPVTRKPHPNWRC
jgi:hypothetical protein